MRSARATYQPLPKAATARPANSSHHDPTSAMASQGLPSRIIMYPWPYRTRFGLYHSETDDKASAGRFPQRLNARRHMIRLPRSSPKISWRRLRKSSRTWRPRIRRRHRNPRKHKHLLGGAVCGGAAFDRKYRYQYQYQSVSYVGKHYPEE